MYVRPDGRTDEWTDGQTNELIRVGLGNLRFLQVNPSSVYLLFSEQQKCVPEQQILTD